MEILVMIWTFLYNDPFLSKIIATIIATIIIGFFRLLFIKNPKEQQKRELMKISKCLEKGYTEREKDMLSQIIMDNKDDKTLSSKAHVGRAKIYLYAKDYDRAINDAQKALLLNEENGDAYIVRGRAYSLKGEHAQAIADFMKALEHVTTRKEDAHLYLGKEHFFQNVYDLAIANYDRALEINSNFITALINRGNAYAKKKILILPLRTII
jgi:tetratricopeptide (TPR) repeat protein